MNKELEKLTNEELIKEYKESYERWDRTWSTCEDGSAEIAYDEMVCPYRIELRKRGIDPKLYD